MARLVCNVGTIFSHQAPGFRMDEEGTSHMGLRINVGNPLLHSGPMPLLTSSQGGNWLIAAGGWFWKINASIHVVAAGLPAMPQYPTDWEVGFIQNIVGVAADFEYSDGTLKRVWSKTPWLDAELSTHAWCTNAATVVLPGGPPISSWASFQYYNWRRGDPEIEMDLSMEDHPSFCYYNFFRGGRQGASVRRISDVTSFRLWIADKPRSAPSHDINSYHFLSMSNEFRVGFNLTISDANPCFARSLAANPTLPPGTGGFNIQPSSTQIHFMAFDGVTYPRVSGPTANQRLPSLYASPENSRRGRFPVKDKRLRVVKSC